MYSAWGILLSYCKQSAMQLPTKKLSIILCIRGVSSTFWFGTYCFVSLRRNEHISCHFQLKRASTTLDTTLSTSWCSCSAKSVKLSKITLASSSSKLSSWKSSESFSLLSIEIAALIDCWCHSMSLLLLLLCSSCVSASSSSTSLIISSLKICSSWFEWHPKEKSGVHILLCGIMCERVWEKHRST